MLQQARALITVQGGVAYSQSDNSVQVAIYDCDNADCEGNEESVPKGWGDLSDLFGLGSEPDDRDDDCSGQSVHRVLVVVTGGVADFAADDAVQVVLVDLDNPEEDREQIPEHWANLVAGS